MPAIISKLRDELLFFTQINIHQCAQGPDEWPCPPPATLAPSHASEGERSSATEESDENDIKLRNGGGKTKIKGRQHE